MTHARIPAVRQEAHFFGRIRPHKTHDDCFTFLSLKSVHGSDGNGGGNLRELVTYT